MVERLILGSGSLVSALVDSLDGAVTVATPDDKLASTMHGSGTEVQTMDPTDERALAALDTDIVFVVEDTREATLVAARAVERALPGAYILVYAAESGNHTEPLERIADRVVNPAGAVASRLLDCVGTPTLPRLWGILRDIEHLAIVAHDNPDPDAIASGVALARLAGAAGCDAEVCYYGNISHHENRALVNLLDLDLRNLGPGADLSAFDGVALVDHARPGVNNGLPPDTPVDVVIDHHPPRGSVEARFVDLRQDIGATSTLLVEYLERYGSGNQHGPAGGSDHGAGRQLLDSGVATALLFGIHVDTHGFTRGVCQQDFEAASTLVDIADQSTLERIESPSIDRETFSVLARAIEKRRIEEGVLFSCVGSLSNRDTLPQAADMLLRLESVQTAVVYGIMDGTVYLSARSRDSDLDLGGTVRSAFGQIGDAGGHVDMAGAQIGLGLVGDLEDDESVSTVVESLIAEQFLEELDHRQQRPAAFDLFDRYRATSEESSDSTGPNATGKTPDDVA